MTPPLQPASGRRSTFVTLIAWLMMIIGIIGVPISGITVVMMVVKSYGTQTSNPMGFVIVVLGPAMLLITGFGLLRRKRWARDVAMILLVMVMASHAWELIKGPRPTTTYTVASGVKTTIMGSSTNYTSLPIIALCLGVLIKLRSTELRDEFDVPPPLIVSNTPNLMPANDHHGWRVGHTGRDMMYYDEKIAGAWHRIDIDGEMLLGRAHHVIYFASAERWQSYPEWARHRRGEIMERIMSDFREPDYEYQVHGQVIASPAAFSAIPSRPVKSAVTAKQRMAMVAAILIMLGIAGGMGWFVTSGISKGETTLPFKRASQQRTISRQQEPASFWASLSIYALIGIGSGGLALWGIRECVAHEG